MRSREESRSRPPRGQSERSSPLRPLPSEVGLAEQPQRAAHLAVGVVIDAQNLSVAEVDELGHRWQLRPTTNTRGPGRSEAPSASTVRSPTATPVLLRSRRRPRARSSETSRTRPSVRAPPRRLVATYRRGPLPPQPPVRHAEAGYSVAGNRSTRAGKMSRSAHGWVVRGRRLGCVTSGIARRRPLGRLCSGPGGRRFETTSGHSAAGAQPEPPGGSARGCGAGLAGLGSRAERGCPSGAGGWIASGGVRRSEPAGDCSDRQLGR